MKGCEPYFDQKSKEELLRYMRQTPEKLKECYAKAKTALQSYEKMIDSVYQDKYKNKEFIKLFQTAKQIGAELDTCPDMDYIRNRVQEQTTAMLKGIYHNEEDERSELLSACEGGKKYLQILINELEIVIPDIEQKVMNLE